MNWFIFRLIDISLAAGWLVLALLVFRGILKKAPKWINPLLWGVVGLRLICPVSIKTTLSLIPSGEVIGSELTAGHIPTINSGFPALDSAVEPVLMSVFDALNNSYPDQVGEGNFALAFIIRLLMIIWIVGVCAMLLYAVISYIKLKNRISTAVPLRDNILQSENVAEPFVVGFFKPKIYLPFKLDGHDMEYVIAHEQAHISRGDNWWKPLGFVILAVHWFNPLAWVAFTLFCRDIEAACDEKVIKSLENEGRSSYSRALLDCSTNRSAFGVCPLAFGEIDVKSRIKSVLNYKKPSFWIVAAVAVVCIVVTVCFATNPQGYPQIERPYVQEYIPGQGNVLGNVDTEKYLAVSDDFAIGANEYGYAVFKDPHKAYSTFVGLYADAINYIREENQLAPLTRTSYANYHTYGWQTPTEDEELSEECIFVSQFLDIYENSFNPPNFA